MIKLSNPIIIVLAGLSLILFAAPAYCQQQPQSGSTSPQAQEQLSPTEIQLNTYVVEISSNDGRFGALYWSNTLEGNGSTFSLNGSVADGTNAIFPQGAFFKRGLILAAPAVKPTIRSLIERGQLKASDPRTTYIKDGQRVLIRSLQHSQTILLQTASTAPATPYTFTTGLDIDVVPRILQGGMIDLTIKPAFSDSQSGTQGDIPIISAGSATAAVKLRMGEAALIGGVTREVHNYITNGVPGLENMPLVAYLLALRRAQAYRTNLVIIVWPRIVKRTPDELPAGEKTIGL
jgi:type II secretory pathway component GspD/PulD (secretin)